MDIGWYKRDKQKGRKKEHKRKEGGKKGCQYISILSAPVTLNTLRDF